MPIAQRQQNLLRYEVAEDHSAGQADQPHGKVFALQKHNRGSDQKHAKRQRQRAVYFHHSRTAKTGAHQLQFFLPKPVPPKYRAVGVAQREIEKVAGEYGTIAAVHVFLKLLKPHTQRVLPHTQQIVQAGDEQGKTGEGSQKEQDWKLCHHSLTTAMRRMTRIPTNSESTP